MSHSSPAPPGVITLTVSRKPIPGRRKTARCRTARRKNDKLVSLEGDEAIEFAAKVQVFIVFHMGTATILPGRATEVAELSTASADYKEREIRVNG